MKSWGCAPRDLAEKRKTNSRVARLPTEPNAKISPNRDILAFEGRGLASGSVLEHTTPDSGCLSILQGYYGKKRESLEWLLDDRNRLESIYLDLAHKMNRATQLNSVGQDVSPHLEFLPGYVDRKGPSVCAGTLLSPWKEGKAFARLRRCVLRTLVVQTLRGSWLQVTIMLILSSVLWLALFALSADGFTFLKNTIPADLLVDVIEVIFGVFFVTLMIMLTVSSAILLFGNLFRSPDVAFLLTLPVRPERVFLLKYQDALLLSSWAFLLLGSPMLLSYGLVVHAPWYYYLVMPFLLVAFIHIPASFGSILCMLLVHRILRRPGLIAVIGATVGLLGLAWGIWYVRSALTEQALAPEWFQQIFARLRFTQHRLLPSWWLSTALLEASRHELVESLAFLGVLAANALFFRQVAIWTAAGVLRRVFAEVNIGRTTKRKARFRQIDRLVNQLLWAFPTQTRVLLLKDFRLFRRDPVQWTQFLIFFGLLVLYFLNIRRFSYETYYQGWVNMVSLLNLAVVALLLSTFTTRFIFPMISLEGRNFWILGLLPLRRDTLLWSKFWFSAVGTLVPCCLLILLSDGMLGVSSAIVLTHQLICVSLCIGLSGLAVGLGAKIPNFREPSPARIAAGFGGTLNLVLSTVLIVVLLGAAGLPTHLLLGSWTPGGGTVAELRPELAVTLRWWWVLGTLASPVIGASFAAIPLWLGIRAFRRMEF
jgi:ABC-2 type transport system permease protein